MKSSLLIASLCLYFATRVTAAIDDYSAYFPFDGAGTSKNNAALQWDKVGTIEFDNIEKVAGTSASKSTEARSGWKIENASTITSLTPDVFSFSAWFRLSEDEESVATLLSRWSGDDQ